MNERFWNLFSDDYRNNCLSWVRHPENPIIPPGAKIWKKRWTANPHFLKLGGKLLLYYRGNGELSDRPGELHDRIVAAEVLEIGPGRLEIRDLFERSVAVDCGKPGEFDAKEALDPAVTVYNGQVQLYYSAIGEDCPDSIGAAVSDDGINFTKLGQVMVGRAPDVIARDGKIYMIYQIAGADGKYLPYLAASTDGMSFKTEERPVTGLMQKGGWSSLSIATMRIYDAGEYVYMMYAGSSYLADEPDYFGLARSKDMISWEQHPGNPIFGCNMKGSPDGGAIWGPALIETDDAFVLLYEGSPGKYDWDLDSQLCMAWIKKP
ncbi:MAG: hypothetical protein ABFD46_12015 [Armatimonadota bacterium]